MKYGNGVVSIVKTYKDFQATDEKNQMTKDLNIEEKKSEIKVQIQNQRIKMYVTKEMEMVNNIYYIYEKIWGQCTEPLYKMIRNLD